MVSFAEAVRQEQLFQPVYSESTENRGVVIQNMLEVFVICMWFELW